MYREGPFDRSWGTLQKLIGAIGSIVIAIPISLILLYLKRSVINESTPSYVIYLITVVVVILLNYIFYSFEISDELEMKITNRKIAKYLKKYKINLPNSKTCNIDTQNVINKLKSIHRYPNKLEEDKNGNLLLFKTIFNRNYKIENIKITQSILDSLQLEFVDYSTDLNEFYLILSYHDSSREERPYDGIIVICRKFEETIEIFFNYQHSYGQETRDFVRTSFLSNLFLLKGRVRTEDIWNSKKINKIRNQTNITQNEYLVAQNKH